MFKFLIFCFVPIWLWAQNPRDYFPTHLGDMWQYINSDGHYVNYTIVKDSIDSIGIEYVEFNVDDLNIPGTYLETFVIDTLNRVWLIDEGSFDNGKAIQFDLRANYRDWYFCGTYSNGEPFYQIVIDTTNTTKTYLFYGSFAEDGNPDSMSYKGGSITLTLGIGRTHQSSEFWSETLNGAIINGIQYGTIYYDTTGIEEPDIALLPEKPQILKTYPNPFNNQLKIEYYLPQSSWFKIEIFSIAGQKVATLLNGYASKGKKFIVWDGSMLNGKIASSGLYFVQLFTKKHKEIKRILLVK